MESLQRSAIAVNVVPTPVALPVVPTTPAALGFVLGRRPELDGLRGVAVLAVMAVHTDWMIPWVPGAFLGVDLFFVLSGFLITVLLVQEHQARGSIHLGAFYLRRALRLLPAVTGLLVVYWVYTLVLGSADDLAVLRNDSAAVLLYLYNWHLVTTPKAAHSPWLGPLWSLSVEEQFYLIWPLVLSVLLSPRVRRRWVVAVVLLGITAPEVVRIFQCAGPKSFTRLYMSTHTRVDGLSFGCLVGILAAWGVRPATERARRLLRAAAWVASGVLVYAFGHLVMKSPIVYLAGSSAVYASTAVLIAAFIWSPPTGIVRALSWAPLRWVGRVSYGVYIWHIPVFVVVIQHLGTVRALAAPWIQFVLMWGGALSIGASSHYVLERPFLRLRDRLEAKRAAPAPDRVGGAAAPRSVPPGIVEE